MGFFFGFNQCQANKYIMHCCQCCTEPYAPALPVRQPAALEQVLARCQDLRLTLTG